MNNIPPNSPFSWDDAASLIAGRIASTESEFVESVVNYISNELASNLEIKPVFLLAGKLSGEAQALIENAIRKVFSGAEPQDIARELLESVFQFNPTDIPPQYDIDGPEE